MLGGVNSNFNRSARAETAGNQTDTPCTQTAPGPGICDAAAVAHSRRSGGHSGGSVATSISGPRKAVEYKTIAARAEFCFSTLPGAVSRGPDRPRNNVGYIYCASRFALQRSAKQRQQYCFAHICAAGGRRFRRLPHFPSARTFVWRFAFVPRMWPTYSIFHIHTFLYICCGTPPAPRPRRRAIHK
jgi:hypothetical protein